MPRQLNLEYSSEAHKPQFHFEDNYRTDKIFYHNGKPLDQAKNKPFISCDLETHTPPNEEKQKVMLFGFSTGDYITGYDIKSYQMLNLIKSVAIKNQRAIFFGFGFDFDVNFIFKDLPKPVVHTVLKLKQPLWWRGFRFEFLSKKYLRISGGSKAKATRWTMTIYEVQGWFSNASLLAAYRDQIGEDKDYLFVEHGKGLRDVFSYEELDTLVIPYWTVEQVMYVRLMERMRELILEAELPIPNHWYGPSAVISRIYQKEKLKAHLRPDRNVVLDDEYIRASQRAYYGGRFEQFKAGYHNDKVYQYDIISAYPSAMLDLWSWQNARMYYVRGSELDRSKPMPVSFKFSVWDIRYTYGRGGDLAFVAPMPFPHRMKNGTVLFPHSTQTSVWSPELEMHWMNADVDILGGWVIEPRIEGSPFSFYRELFERRDYLKSINNPAQYAVKIAINSGYGKVAQRVGAKFTDGKWQIPPYHQLDWAGYITSHCRASIWRAITLVGWDSVISVETDGIFTTKPITGDAFPRMHCTRPFTTGNSLGQWEETVWDGMVSIQSGIYWLRDSSSQTWLKAKQRGLRRLGAKGVTAEEAIDFLHRYHLDKSFTLSSPSTQFHGIGHVHKDKWLTWTRRAKEITFAGTGKRQHLFDKRDPSLQLVTLHNKSVMLDEHEISWPHPLPWSDYGNYEPKQLFDEAESMVLEYDYD